MSFVLATEGAMRQAFNEGVWQIIEPIMLTEVTAPNEYQSSVIGNLNKRNALITNTEINQDWFTIYSEIALNDMFGFATELRSVTQGKGEFAMEYLKYLPTRPETAAKLCALANPQKVDPKQQYKQKKKN
jgi:elongation factor G